MRRRARAAAALAFAAALLCGTESEAADPGLSVQGAGGASGARQAQSLAAQALGLASGAGAGSGPMLYLDPSRSARSLPGFENLSAADRNLALAGDKVLEMMRALGDPSDRGAVLQRRDSMYYVGIDGEGGRWFASAGEAIGFMFQGMVAKSQKFAAATKESVANTCAQDILCAVSAVAQDPYVTVATVTRGGTVSVAIAGQGFSNAGGGPSVASGDGILALSVAYAGPERIDAVLQIAPNAKLGEHYLAVFNDGLGFQNAGVYKLAVKDGTGAAPVTQQAGRASAKALALAAAGEGLLAGDGQDQYWRIDVTAAGTLILVSSGGADLKGTLEDAGGVGLASDDDAGGWYNFRLSRAVAPGTYYLRVGHCCGGAGAYKVTATLGP
jgi:hypothetical protein